MLTGRPFTRVPFVLSRSVSRIRPPSSCNFTWNRLTRSSLSRRLFSSSRPIVTGVCRPRNVAPRSSPSTICRVTAAIAAGNWGGNRRAVTK